MSRKGEIVTDDPLARFRCDPHPNDNASKKSTLTEHEALNRAIEALNKIPNYKIKMEGYMILV